MKIYLNLKHFAGFNIDDGVCYGALDELPMIIYPGVTAMARHVGCLVVNRTVIETDKRVVVTFENGEIANIDDTLEVV